MIPLTRISGSAFMLNADLIERIDSTPDTVISLVDGKKYVVLESLHDVTHAIRAFRSSILALSYEPLVETPVPDPAGEPRLAVASHLASVARLREDG